MNRLDGMLCYLSGPMDRVPDGGVQWRLDITPFLLERGVGVLNPCDKACGHQETPEERELIKELRLSGQFDAVREKVKPIVNVDLRMVDISHFLICYVDNTVHMCGTYDEIFMAALQKKPVIFMCKQGKENMPGWLFGRFPHEIFFSSWEEVKDYLNHIHTAPNDEVYDLDKWRFFDFNKVFGKDN